MSIITPELIDKSKLAVEKYHKDLTEVLFNRITKAQNVLNELYETLPDFLKEETTKIVSQIDVFALLDLPDWILAASEAVKLMKHFDCRSEYEAFINNPAEYAMSHNIEMSNLHNEKTFQLLVGFANQIAEKNLPKIALANDSPIGEGTIFKPRILRD